MLASLTTATANDACKTAAISSPKNRKIYPKLPSTIFLATPPLLAFVHEAWRQQTDE